MIRFSDAASSERPPAAPHAKRAQPLPDYPATFDPSRFPKLLVPQPGPSEAEVSLAYPHETVPHLVGRPTRSP